MCGEFGERTAHGLLELFGDFARDGGSALCAKHGRQLFERLHNAEGRFVENHGALFGGQSGQVRLAAFFLRQEPLETEAVARQPRIDQGWHESGGSGQALHLDTSGHAGAHQQKTWVGDGGRAGIGHQSDGFATQEAIDHGIDLLVFVELVMRLHGRVYVVVVEQHRRGARVLGQHEVGFAQHTQGAQRDVVHIADGCGNKVEHKGRRLDFVFFVIRSFLLTTKRNEPKKSRQLGRERCQKLAVLVSAAPELANAQTLTPLFETQNLIFDTRCPMLEFFRATHGFYVSGDLQIWLFGYLIIWSHWICNFLEQRT